MFDALGQAHGNTDGAGSLVSVELQSAPNAAHFNCAGNVSAETLLGTLYKTLCKLSMTSVLINACGRSAPMTRTTDIEPGKYKIDGVDRLV
jgi:hypothetical protein